jgi:hypothetical protein
MKPEGNEHVVLHYRHAALRKLDTRLSVAFGCRIANAYPRGSIIDVHRPRISASQAPGYTRNDVPADLRNKRPSDAARRKRGRGFPRGPRRDAPGIEHDTLVIDFQVKIVDQKRCHSSGTITLYIEGEIALAVHDPRVNFRLGVTDDELQDHGAPTKLK